MSPSPTNEHWLKVKRLEKLIERVAPSGAVTTSPMTVYMIGHGPDPDVFWVSDESPCHVEADGYWYSPPELVFEVLSTNKVNDRKAKFEIYERAGVREYWLVGIDFVEVFINREGHFVRLSAGLRLHRRALPHLSAASGFPDLTPKSPRHFGARA